MESQSQLEKNYSILKVLGSGSFGVVFDCQNKWDEKRSAVKVTFLLDLSAPKEVLNLAKLSHHDNIVQYLGCWKDTMKFSEIRRIMGSELSNFTIPAGLVSLDLLFIQMELCSENLRDWLGRQTSVGEETHFRISLQMARGLQHIHTSGLIHRDLKPDNIFLSFGNSLEVKVGDLGISTDSGSGSKYVSRTKGSGTPLYSAPEQETTKFYGKEVDVFALGLIFFELSSPEIQPERNGGDPVELVSALTELKFRAKLPPGFNENWPTLQGMIEIKPTKRATIQEVINFFSPNSKPPIFSAKAAVCAVANQNFVIHSGVPCNGCGLEEIVGVRYKCSVCSGYSLCEKCENRVGMHPENHPFLKLKEPLKTETKVAALSNFFGSSSLSPVAVAASKKVIKVRTVEELKNALATCVSGNTIELEEGNYIMRIVLHKDNIKIIGKGSKTRIKFVGDEDTNKSAIELGGNYCEVRDIHVIAGKGKTGVVSFGNYNIIHNVELEGQRGRIGFELQGNFNKITNGSAKGFVTNLKASGNDNTINTVSVGAEFKNNFCCIEMQGNRNIFSNVTILDDENPVVIEGQENCLTNCVSTTKMNCLFTGESSALCNIEGGVFHKVNINGTNNELKMVDATQCIHVRGKGHSFEDCTAPQFIYVEKKNKNSIKLIGNSFAKTFG